MDGTLSSRRGLKSAMTPVTVSFTFQIIISLQIPQIDLILTGTLKSLDVLGALSQLSNGLNEGNTSLLVGFEWSKDSTRHDVVKEFKFEL